MSRLTAESFTVLFNAMHPAIATALLLFGAFFLVAITAHLIRKYRSAKWPSVEGVITKSTVELEKKGKVWSHYPKVEYRFQVDGETFEGDRIAGTASGSPLKADAEQAAQKFPEGSPCKVYYEPDKPSECMLQPGLKAGDLIGLVIPLPFIAIGGHFLIKAFQ